MFEERALDRVLCCFHTSKKQGASGLFESSLREQLLQFSHVLQGSLFPRLELEWGSLGEKARLLVAVVGMLPLSRYVGAVRGWRGRPLQDRQALATAFLAEIIYGCETTRQVLERLRSDAQLRCLCGWNTLRQIPHESTFSRAFAGFAESELPQRLHAALIEDTQRDRLIGHIARAATAIEAREKFPESKPAKHKEKARRQRAKASERGTRLERQRKQTLAQQLAALPREYGDSPVQSATRPSPHSRPSQALSQDRRAQSATAQELALLDMSLSGNCAPKK